MFIPLPDGARVVVGFNTALAEAYSNVFHFTKAGFTTGDLQDLVDDILTATNTELMPSLSTNTGVSTVTGYDMRTAGGVVVTDQGVGAAGSDAAEMLPINIALVATLRTATRGRSGRGRVYVAGWTEAAQAGGNFGAGQVLAVGDWLDAINSAAQTNGFVWVIMSKQQNGVTLNPAVGRPVISHEVRSTLVGTQRRRVDRP